MIDGTAVHIASDYAVAESDGYQFYYGYEHTRCPEHGDDARCEDCEVEWCFVAKKDGREFERFPLCQHQNDVDRNLIEGMARVFVKYGNPMMVST